jgi:hypothetical protein
MKEVLSFFFLAQYDDVCSLSHSEFRVYVYTRKVPGKELTARARLFREKASKITVDVGATPKLLRIPFRGST